ncbi:MAG: Rpn family recombination-promoting nuclease/putative transposase [Clostridiales bacterium]|nr:Rpn family recombination-promoting nuclease/putative transposase [Clostridiales bacterium]
MIFHLFFADERNAEFLLSFLKSTIDLPEEDYGELEILDPLLLREYPGDKLGIIDVKLKTKSKKIIHIEIQLSVTPEFINRIVYYARALYERRDAEMFLRDAERRGKKQNQFEIAKNLLTMNLSTDQIVTATGLTREEVESIHR